MLDMSKYAGVQNPQLYQEILDKERKRQQSQSHSPPYEPGYAAPSSSNWTQEQKQSAVELMGKTQSTNLYSSLRNGVYGSGPVQAPKPGVYLDTSNGEIEVNNIFRVLGAVAADYAQTGKAKHIDLKLPDPSTIKDHKQVWIDEGGGAGYFVDRPVYDDGTEQQTAPGTLSPSELEQYKKDYADSGMFFEPGMEIGEDGAFKNQLLELDALQQVVIQERDNRQAAGEKFYDDNQEYFEQVSSDLQEMSDSYSELNLGNEVLSYETVVSMYYGRADEQTINSLSKEQLYAYECWAKLAEEHDMVTEYIIHYGERGIFTREYAEKLSRQMDAIVKYDKNYMDQLGYYFSELLAGVVSVGESALRFTLALGLGLTSAGASLFGADEYAEDTKNAAKGWLSESWAQQMREGAQDMFKADAGDMRAGRKYFIAGQILPGVIIAASTGGAGAGTMLGAGASTGYSTYAIVGALSTAGTCAQTALQEGASVDQALTYGALAGILDLGATAAFGGLNKKLGIDTGKIAQKIAGNYCETELGTYIAKQFISAAIEQPADTLAFQIQPELKRLTYDPNAKSYTKEQIAEATVMGFTKHSLRNLAFSLPEFVQILNGANTNTKLSEHIKQQVDENLKSAITKAQAGETPDTGAAAARPELAATQMDANTAADMGNQRFEAQDAGDRLASVLASDPELVGIEPRAVSDGNGISPMPQGQSQANTKMPASGEQAGFFTQMFAGETGQTVGGQKIGEADALPSSYTKSGDLDGWFTGNELPAGLHSQKTPKDISAEVKQNDFGKIFDFEVNRGIEAQTMNYGNSEMPQSSPIESNGNATVSNGIMDKKNPYINIDEVYPKLRTEKDTAYFWSGNTDGVGGVDVAAEIATSKGGVTLETLIANKNIDMPRWNAEDPYVTEAWELASSAYAEQVSGEIRAVVGKNLRPGNIWENIELKRLQGNPSVTRIITIDPVTRVETIIFER